MNNDNNKSNPLEPAADSLLILVNIAAAATFTIAANIITLSCKGITFLIGDIKETFFTKDIKNNSSYIVDVNNYDLAPTKTDILSIDTSKYKAAAKASTETIKSNSSYIEIEAIFDYEIPTKAAYKTYIHNKENSLCCCIGVGLRGKKIIVDFFKDGSLLIGGASRWGKTSLIYSMLLSLMENYNSCYLRIVLVDFKEVDLTRLENKKHILGKCITTIENFNVMLEWIEEEIKKRKELFKLLQVANIEEYNSISGQKLQVVVIVIDEIAQILCSDKKEADKIRARLFTIICKCMAFGIYMVVCTQELSRDTLGKMKINFTQSIGLKCIDKTSSDLIIKGGDLEDITVKGRAKIDNSEGITEFQTYFTTIKDFERIENK